MTHDIIVSIYACHKAGDKSKRGPDSLDTYGAAAGVSMLSTRPEGAYTLDQMLPDGWTVDGEVGGVEQLTYRKRVTITLPEGVEYGPYTIDASTLTGLHSTQHTSTDGMGATVYAYVREARLMDDGETREQAIDRAIKSGIMLAIPTSTGGRESVQADVVSVSGMFGDTETTPAAK